jgi:hypothetical protein
MQKKKLTRKQKLEKWFTKVKMPSNPKEYKKKWKGTKSRPLNEWYLNEANEKKYIKNKVTELSINAILENQFLILRKCK